MYVCMYVLYVCVYVCMYVCMYLRSLLNSSYFYVFLCCLDVINSCKQYKLIADEGIVSRAGMIQELVMVRDDLLCMSTDDFTHNGVLALVEHLCVD